MESLELISQTVITILSAYTYMYKCMHGVVHTKLCKLQQRLNILVMTFGVDGATSSTLCAFVEVRKEVSKADSRDVYDNVKRALEKNENPMPERFIVSHHEGYNYLSLYMFI